MNSLAGQQLHELADVSDGAIEIISSRSNGDKIVFDMSLDTRGIETHDGGIRVRARVRFLILVDETYPYSPPSVWVPHRRWAGTPHVQWGRHLCLYAAPSVEWNPADGMRGLVARLKPWLQRAAEGTLDPDGQPLHPPVAYSSAEAGKIIINPDLGGLAPWAEQLVSGQTALIYAWCERDRKRVDVIEWLSPLEVYDRVLAKDFTAQDDAGRPFFVAPLVLVSDELGMEYPDKASALADSLDGFGVSRNQLLRGLTSASTINRHIGSLAGITNEPPVVVLLGTPARRVTGNNRLAHITAWHFDDLGERILNLLGDVQHYDNDLTDEVRSIAEDWLGIADINWMVVYENRPEVTNRRDSGSAASWLIGKRLVLGCGALGAPIAEQCVRAGVSSLTVADNGSVNPGILVRQPYTDADVGFNKARRLAKRLSTIRRDLVVQPVSSNVISMFIGDDGAPPDFDLVIDATADVSVRAAVEAARTRRRDEWPPLITGLFGHDAVRAIATLSRPGATGGAHDILRRLVMEARGAAANNWSDIAEISFLTHREGTCSFPNQGVQHQPSLVQQSRQMHSHQRCSGQ